MGAWRERVSARGLATVVVGAAGVFAWGPQAAGGTYEIPCGGATASCPFGLRPCSEVRPELVINLQKLLDEKVRNFYAGVDKAIVQSSPATSSSSAGTPDKVMDLPICNPAEGEETMPNPPRPPPPGGGGCGNYVWMSRTLVVANGGTAPDGTTGCGKREASYFRGAYIAALTCFTKEVMNEVTAGVVDTSNCADPAADATGANSQLSSKMTSSMTTLSALCDLDEARFTDYCKVASPTLPIPTPAPSPSFYPVNADQIKHLESACYLAAGRARAESTSVYVALCEAIARTKHYWPFGYARIKAWIDAEVNLHCANVASDSIASGGSCSQSWDIAGWISGDIANPDCAVEQAFSENCYKVRYFPKMQEILAEIYPSTVSTATPCYRGGP